MAKYYDPKWDGNGILIMRIPPNPTPANKQKALRFLIRKARRSSHISTLEEQKLLQLN